MHRRNGDVPVAKPAGSAALVLVHYAVPLHPEETLFEAMLEGWRRQHAARRLSPTITRQRQRMVRRFTEFTGLWPWQWRAEHLDARVAQGRWAHSTVRNYQGSIAQFMDYLCDPRYGRPITAAQLGNRLRLLGIEAQAARRGALLHLGASLPAAVLARLLDLHPNTAVRWVRAAGGDWNTYAAQLLRSGSR